MVCRTDSTSMYVASHSVRLFAQLLYSLQVWHVARELLYLTLRLASSTKLCGPYECTHVTDARHPPLALPHSPPEIPHHSLASHEFPTQPFTPHIHALIISSADSGTPAVARPFPDTQSFTFPATPNEGLVDDEEPDEEAEEVPKPILEFMTNLSETKPAMV